MTKTIVPLLQQEREAQRTSERDKSAENYFQKSVA